MKNLARLLAFSIAVGGVHSTGCGSDQNQGTSDLVLEWVSPSGDVPILTGVPTAFVVDASLDSDETLTRVQWNFGDGSGTIDGLIQQAHTF